MGGSAGALEALLDILGQLPGSFSWPIAVVLHLPRRQPSSAAQLLAARCALQVHEAEDKQPFLGGAAYLAPPGYHLLVDDGPRLALSMDEPVSFSMPSIDVLFESAAQVFGRGLTAVVLSGANQDGANGLRAICAARGTALVQSPEQAAVPNMPSAALSACSQARSMTSLEIGRLLIQIERAGA